jgi:multidrug transporter EmrE-like cation transporter
MIAYAAIALTIAFTVLSQMLQKKVALHRAATQNSIIEYLHSRDFRVALLCLILAMVFWFYALTQVDVSKAYALLSANYLLVPWVAQRWLGEPINTRQWCGAAILFIGLLLVGHS